jgi:uncharacterized protein YcbK (DUF882 family)
VTARWVALSSVLIAALTAASATAKPPHGYYAQVARWHAKQPGETAPKDAAGRAKLVLESINLRERVELVASKDDGGFSDAELERAAHVLRDSRNDTEHAIDPKLLDLLYALEKHFAAPCIRVVSAYRTPHGKSGSQHSRGHAADVVVPGATDRDVASHARTLGTTGIGLYPVSGFVHVDVRERSHYWVDSSGPGQHKHRKKHGNGKPHARPKRSAAKR